MSDETITMQEWVEAIQDVASLESALREPQSQQKQQTLLQARRLAVERVLAMRFLTGSTTDRIETILETEQWAVAYYNDLSKESEDDLGQPNTQGTDNSTAPAEAGGFSDWYSGASPFSRGR